MKHEILKRTNSKTFKHFSIKLGFWVSINDPCYMCESDVPFSRFSCGTVALNCGSEENMKLYEHIKDFIASLYIEAGACMT